MNGAIHGIDKVLRPRPGLNQYVAFNRDLSTFAAVLDTFTLRRYDAENSSDVDGDGVIDSVFTEESLLDLEWRDQEELFTVFAPTNAAFAAFLATAAPVQDHRRRAPARAGVHQSTTTWWKAPASLRTGR
jgi:hypothetical protein